MPAKERHVVFSLGSIASDASSAEIDLGSMNWAFFYGTATGGTADILFEVNPADFGETGAWYKFGNTVQVTGGTSVCLSAPFDDYNDYMVPRRARITVPSGSTGSLTDVYVEGIREIG